MRDRSTWRSFAPLALAVLVMLPRLASAQFGFLDDGLTLQTGREMNGRWSSVLYLIPETGRFFPMYWLTYSVIYAALAAVGGVRPLAFFAVNVLVLAAVLAILVRVVRWSGGTPIQAGVAAVVFAVSAPAIEAFYTHSKAEPFQMTWIGLSLLAAAASAARASAAPSGRRAALIVAAAAALLLAYATKETSAVLVPISLGWLAAERWCRDTSRTWTRFAATYLAVNLIAAAAFFTLRAHYAALPLAEGSYTRAYALREVGPALFRILAWLARDFAFVLPLALAAPFLSGGTAVRRRPLVYASVWMVGWLAVYLPWPATFEYYLLPFAFGAALVVGLAVGDLWRGRGREQPAARRRLASAALAAGGLLWGVALVNAVADARVQLAVDRVNAAFLDFLGGLPSGSRVVLNMSPVNEYHFELPMHLAEIARRPDLVVERLTPAALRPPVTGDAFVVTAEMANEPRPTVRIAPHEPGVRRDQATLSAIPSGRADLVYRSVQHTRLVEIAVHRLLCPLAVRPVIDPSFCPPGRGLIDRRTFSYGWQVHRLVERALRPSG